MLAFFLKRKTLSHQSIAILFAWYFINMLWLND